MDDTQKTAPRAALPTSPALTHVQVGAVVEMFTQSLRTLVDGRWEPKADIPAIGKLLIAAGFALAAGGFGLRELAQAYLTLQGGG